MSGGFYDIHCHILHGADDGPTDLEEALKLIQLAYEDGTRHIVLTPHFQIGTYELPAEELRRRFLILREAAAKQYPDISLYLGMEVGYHSNAAKKFAQKELLTMNDTNYTLVEFFPESDRREILHGLKELQMMGKRPILAHVERYQELLRNPRLVDEIQSMGVCIQVNASSILGKRGFRIKRFTKKLLDYGMIDFVASDGHDLTDRQPKLKECVSYITKKWGEEYARRIFIHNPEKMLRNECL